MGKVFGKARRRFARSEDGSVTFETVLWMPVFAALLCIIADASMIFGRKAEVLRVIQDANRAMSVGRFTTTTEEKNFIMARIKGIAPHAKVETTVVAGVVQTKVTIPASDFTANTPIGVLDSLKVVVSAEHLLEA